MNENNISASGTNGSNRFDISTEKIIPTAPEAEKSVLGCVFLDKDSMIQITDLLLPEDFYYDYHRFIYEAMLDLFHKSQPVDIVTVATKLQASGQLETVGGPDYLTQLQDEVPVATHIFQYAQIVKHRATLRKLIKAGNEITGLGYDAEKNVEELLESAEKKVFSISQNFVRDKFVPIKEILTNSYERFCEIHEDPGIADRHRIKTNLRDIDNKLNGGLNPSDLIIVAARPSMGKTSLALEFAQNAAIQQKKHIGIISLEMSKEQMVERMFCARLGVDSWKLQKGKLSEDDFEKMGPLMDELGSASIYIDDSMGGSIVALRSKARRLKMEHNLDMLIIDYLQLMSGNNPMNRVQEISEISRSLKQIARELHIPVLALSQLSRNVESRPDKRPVLSDLRDSGSIEQDADIVMMLYRDDYYNEDSEKKNELEINILKHRNGGTGRVSIMFDRSRMTFSDLDQNKQAGF